MSRYIIALTGGIGSGKSTVADIIRSLGYEVFDCDEITREITGTESFLSDAKGIDERFVKTVDGKPVYDRKAVSGIVFSDEKKLEKLNSLIHPRVFERLKELKESAKGDICFCEIQLLFETQSENRFDGTMIVVSDLKRRTERIEKRNGFTKEQILAIMSTQTDYDKIDKDKYVVIDNDCDGNELRKETERAVSEIEKAVATKGKKK